MQSVFGKINYGGLKHNSLYLWLVLPSGGWQSLIDFGNNCNMKMHHASKSDYFNRMCKRVFKNHYKTWFKSKLFWVEWVPTIINDQKNLINMKYCTTLSLCLNFIPVFFLYAYLQLITPRCETWKCTELQNWTILIACVNGSLKIITKLDLNLNCFELNKSHQLLMTERI